MSTIDTKGHSRTVYPGPCKISLTEELYIHRLRIDTVSLDMDNISLTDLLHSVAIKKGVDIAIDYKAAAEDIKARIIRIAKPLLWDVSDDGLWLTDYHNCYDDIQRAYKGIDRMAAIDWRDMLMSHQDDGYVQPNPWTLYTLADWDKLTAAMDKDLYDMLSEAMEPCTHQELADAYAEAHWERHCQPWPPYNKQ
ncbi:MAG: hypothetical protein [Caudoviricetes sp.]|nr:MAG: hypothetical protein [Caudoviricetes sp.]